MKFRITIVALLLCSAAIAQVGIGTVTPDPSAVLDVSSEAQGLLAPRMTTAQRNAITTPANSLLVYDTTLDAYYYYNTATTSWLPMSSGAAERDNFVLVKSVADFPAPSGGVITLDPNTYYEINGTIVLTNPIVLNNAYVAGLDVNEDVLSSAGTVFSGSTGGTIRNITITGGGTAFNITGGASLIIRNSIVAGMSSVGTISGVDLFFADVVQFASNTNGITYNNIGSLLLNNLGWQSTNAGTYETLTGTFGLVQKVSGFSVANGTAKAMDVSSNPTVSNGVLFGTVFTGTSTMFIDRYTTGSYTGFNFSNSWSVNCPGIPEEDDDLATINLYYSSSSITVLNDATPRKLPVTTLSTRNFRTGTGGLSNNVLYEGAESRPVNVFGSISFTAIAGMRVTFSIYKNGVLVPGTEVVYDVVSTNGRQGLSIVGTVLMNPTDNIEIYIARNTGSGSNQFLVTSYNLLVD